MKDAPEGETFETLYNQETLEPLPEYRRLYEEVRSEVQTLGVNFRE